MYPSTLTSFTNPLPTDRLNSPSHSSIETAQNTQLTQLQTFIGVNTGITASAVGTLLYDIRGIGSNGGGHVQTAAKGGTGQTIFTKGDILVAANSSTLSKLAVGSSDQIILADSTTATGIRWANNTSPKLYATASTIGVAAGGGETSILSVTVPGSTLGTTNAIRTTAFLTNWVSRNGRSVLAAVQLGGNRIASVLVNQGGTGTADMRGAAVVTHTIISSTLSNQTHFLELSGVMREDGVAGVTQSQSFQQSSVINSFAFPHVFATNTSSVASGAPQTLGMTVEVRGDNSSLSNTGVIVEKIV